MEGESLAMVRSELAALREMVARLLVQSGERPRLYELREAARLLGVAPKTVGRMVAHGEILPVMIRGKRMVPLSEIDRLSAPPVMRSGGVTERTPRFDAAATALRMKELKRKRG